MNEGKSDRVYRTTAKHALDAVRGPFSADLREQIAELDAELTVLRSDHAERGWILTELVLLLGVENYSEIVAAVTEMKVQAQRTGREGRTPKPARKKLEMPHCLGPIVAEWLDDGRTMQLVEEYVFTDPNGVNWVAPAGSVVDGASIPRFLWSLIGGPFTGRYRKASVVHDVYCTTRTRAWPAVHRMFYDAMRCSLVNDYKARLMYSAVRLFGPRWDPMPSPEPEPDIQLKHGDWARLESFLGEHMGLSESLSVEIL